MYEASTHELNESTYDVQYIMVDLNFEQLMFSCYNTTYIKKGNLLLIHVLLHIDAATIESYN